VEALLSKLGAKEWLQREAAQDALADLGPGILPRLKGHARTTTDMEVKKRLEQLIDRLAGK